MKHTIRIYFVTLLCLMAWFPVATEAQSDFDTGLDVFPNLSLGGLDKQTDNPASFSATCTVGENNEANLSITAQLASGWHIYSLTQKAGGPTPTTLTIAGDAKIELLQPFTPDSEPLKSVNDAWPGLTVEEHDKKVVWSAKVKLPESFDGPVQIAIKALVCKTDGACLPIDKTVDAELVRSDQVAPMVASDTPATNDTKNEEDAKQTDAPVIFRDSDYVVQWSSRIEPPTVAPGSTARLIFTATPDKSYHVYASATDDSESSTNFVVTEKAGLRIGEPVTSARVVSETFLPGLPPVEYHAGAVTWALPIQIPADATTGEKKIEGSVGYQACTDSSCLPPKALRFTAIVNVSDEGDSKTSSTPVTLVSASYPATLDEAAETKWVDDVKLDPATVPAPKGDDAPPNADRDGAGSLQSNPEPQGDNSTIVNGDSQKAEPVVTEASGFPLPAILAMAICGGLILNLMPCVLPVVGLKVMAFAEQAGEDKTRVLLLNVWYTLGILVVFWALAAVAVLFSFSWGEQFTYFGFRYGVTLLVFAMALSFLGVWEIPIPGFVGGNSTQKLQRREGPAGAFFKGIFTTLLATPCSGPLLGTVFAFTLGKSAMVTTLIFTAVGFGMALPYLLIALYPALIMYFPKPGVWMDTFKQLLAFLLLGTVVYLFGGFSDDDRMPVFASLIGVWFGCWIIGQVPGWSRLDRRIAAWLGGTASATLICVLAFKLLAPGPPVLAWEPYNETRLKQLQSEGRTVLIDFTAKWCVNCIVNYNVAINTAETSKLVNELNAVPMLADWTDHNDEIKNKLIELNSNSIPVLAIYPGKQPDAPIILRDLISQNDVLEALRQADSVSATNDLNARGVSPKVRQVSNRQSELVSPTH